MIIFEPRHNAEIGANSVRETEDTCSRPQSLVRKAEQTGPRSRASTYSAEFLLAHTGLLSREAKVLGSVSISNPYGRTLLDEICHLT